jgi:hypothetical protein
MPDNRGETAAITRYAKAMLQAYRVLSDIRMPKISSESSASVRK